LYTVLCDVWIELVITGNYMFRLQLQLVLML